MEPLGVQSCITACQRCFIDCNIACDSRRSCHKLCAQRVASCIDRCRELDQEPLPSDAGTDGEPPEAKKPSDQKPGEKATPQPKKTADKKVKPRAKNPESK
ncbi:MAG: hypothetical protein HRU17_06320 [Polyangiaceae bacterium]|nr:hypothetical protein [Polyangiaceae bacterium]